MGTHYDPEGGYIDVTTIRSFPQLQLEEQFTQPRSFIGVYTIKRIQLS